MASITASLVLLFTSVLIVFLFLIIYALTKFFGHFRLSTPAPTYGITSITENGEIVRSYSEKRIADYFKANNIRYFYEQTADSSIHNPDFYLPDYDVYVEFWGLLNADDPWTRQNYERNMRRKMAIYHQKNKRLVSIYPDNLDNLDWIFRKKFQSATGFDLPN